MARDQIDMAPIASRDELVAWFEAGCTVEGRARKQVRPHLRHHRPRAHRRTTSPAPLLRNPLDHRLTFPHSRSLLPMTLHRRAPRYSARLPLPRTLHSRRSYHAAPSGGARWLARRRSRARHLAPPRGLRRAAHRRIAKLSPQKTALAKLAFVGLPRQVLFSIAAFYHSLKAQAGRRVSIGSFTVSSARTYTYMAQVI